MKNIDNSILKKNTSGKLSIYYLSILCCLISLISACTTFEELTKPEVRNLFIAQEFVPENYYVKSFLLAPLVSSADGISLSESDSHNYNTNLKGAFEQYRPEINIKDYFDAVPKIGKDVFLGLNNEYSEQGLVSKQSLELIYNKLDTKYLIVSELLYSNLKSEWEEDKQEEHVDVMVSSKRKTTAVFTIYDTEFKKVVWRGSLNNSSSTSTTYKVNRNRYIGRGKSLLSLEDAMAGRKPSYDSDNDTSYYERYPAPEPDSELTMMDEQAKWFVLNLAKLDKSQK